MKDYKRMTVGEIVADNFNNAGIFDKYGIDFCCHGSALLPEASKNCRSRYGEGDRRNRASGSDNLRKY